MPTVCWLLVLLLSGCSPVPVAALRPRLGLDLVGAVDAQSDDDFNPPTPSRPAEAAEAVPATPIHQYCPASFVPHPEHGFKAIGAKRGCCVLSKSLAYMELLYRYR